MNQNDRMSYDAFAALAPKTSGNTVNATVSVTGKVKGKNWYRVAHAGNMSYVFAPLLAASSRAEINLWNIIKQSQNRLDLVRFIKSYSNGPFVDRAKRRLAALPVAHPPQNQQICHRRPLAHPQPLPNILPARCN
jgi:hypothetical protein